MQPGTGVWSWSLGDEDSAPVSRHSGFGHERHLDASKLHDVAVLEGVGLGTDGGPVDDGELVLLTIAFDVGEEVTLRTP